MIPYRAVKVRNSAGHSNKQTNTELKLCGPWLAPDVSEVISLHSNGNKKYLSIYLNSDGEPMQALIKKDCQYDEL